MTFRTAFFFFVYGAVLWAFGTLSFFADLHLPAIVLFLSATILAAMRRRMGLGISSGVWLAMSIAVILLALWSWFVIQERLYTVVYTFLYLQANKLWTAEKNRDYLQIFGLTFFQMLTASVSTASVLFAPALIVYLFLVLGGMITLTMKKDAELAFKPARRNKALSARTPRSHRAHQEAFLGSLAGSPHLNRRFLQTLSVALLSILVCGMSLFYVIPRLKAQSFITGFSSSRPPQLVSGFTEDIDFIGMGEIQTDTTIAARAIPGNGYIIEGGYPSLQFLRLRGTALDHYDGRRWERSAAVRAASGPIGRRQFVELRNVREPDESDLVVSTTIQLEPNSSRILFAPGQATHYAFDASYDFVHDPVSHAMRLDVPRWTSTLSYQVRSILPGPAHLQALGDAPAGSAVALASETEEDDLYLPRLLLQRLLERPRDRELLQQYMERREVERHYLQLPNHPDIETVRTLAEQWTEDMDSPWDIAREIQYRLKANYGYSLDVSFSQREDHLTAFLTSVRAGHCEYFATAMTLMLRARGIPARIVNGYATDEWVRSGGGYYLVRQAHAHSWVEAYMADRGWVTYDPTPLSGIGSNRLPSNLHRVITRWMDALKFQWYDKVIDYDVKDQEFIYHAVFRGLRNIPDPAELMARTAGEGNGLKWAMAIVVLGAGGVAGFVLLRRFGKGRNARKDGGNGAIPASLVIAPYRELLAEAERRVERTPAQTPLEYARTVADRRSGLDDFVPVTLIYYGARYNGYQWTDRDSERTNALLRRLREESRNATERANDVPAQTTSRE